AECTPNHLALFKVSHARLITIPAARRPRRPRRRSPAAPTGRGHTMHTHVIQRQYDEVIAPHYDADPQSAIGDSLDRAVAQLREQPRVREGATALRVLDLGMGTGRFLTKLAAQVNRPLQPTGLDLSERMVAIARGRVPDLVAVVDDARNLD